MMNKAGEKRGDDLKHDAGKPMWDLLPFGPVGEIVKVMSFGAKKYGAESWKKIPDARNRYFAAIMRHITSWWGGEMNDQESGLHHLAHAGCCLLFLMWFEIKQRERCP